MGVIDSMRRSLWWLPVGKVPEVGARELDAMRKGAEPPQILDVRTVAEWRRSHIPGSVNVPISELAGRLDALGLDKGRAVVAICLSAHRSIPAVRLLRARGFEQVTQLAGGMKAWWAEGLGVKEL